MKNQKIKKTKNMNTPIKLPITQKKLAGLIGMKKSVISEFLRGDKQINAVRAQEIADRTGVSMRGIISREPGVRHAAFESVFGAINKGRGRVKK